MKKATPPIDPGAFNQIAFDKTLETRLFWETGFTFELWSQLISQFLTRDLVFAQRLPSDFVHRAVCLQTFILLKALDSGSSAGTKNAVDRAWIVTL